MEFYLRFPCSKIPLNWTKWKMRQNDICKWIRQYIDISLSDLNITFVKRFYNDNLKTTFFLVNKALLINIPVFISSNLRYLICCQANLRNAKENDFARGWFCCRTSNHRLKSLEKMVTYTGWHTSKRCWHMFWSNRE